jgi:hypothetical protein
VVERLVILVVEVELEGIVHLVMVLHLYEEVHCHFQI